MTDYISKDEFNWTRATIHAYLALKEIMSSTSVLCLPYFLKVFEVVCDASGIGPSGMLSQEGHPIGYFSEKLNDIRQWYSTYDNYF